MKLDRIFIELSGYVIDVDAVTAYGEARSAEAENPDTVIFLSSGSTVYVSESVATITELIHNAYVKVAGTLAQPTTDPFDAALGYPR